MWGDEVLKQVRATREAQAARFQFDLHKIVEDLRKRESTSGHAVLMPRATESNGATVPNQSLHQSPRKAGPLVS